jgi:Icc-related predicted phosphoesterase
MALRFLIASDIHDDLAAVEQLKREIHELGFAPNVVLCPGDLTCLPTKIGVELPEDVVAAGAQNGRAILQSLKELVPDGQVVFVPGNHDPITWFDQSDPSLREMAELGLVNAHDARVRVSTGLSIIGFGGCTEALEDGRVVWSAYPYTESEMTERLAATKKRLCETDPGETTVLMTHFGSAASATTWVTGMDPNSLVAPGLRKTIINSGSSTLDPLLAEAAVQASVVLNLHGHTHQGCGMTRRGAITVLNPGSLCFTRTYALVTMKRANETGRWSLASTEIRSLA